MINTTAVTIGMIKTTLLRYVMALSNRLGAVLLAGWIGPYQAATSFHERQSTQLLLLGHRGIKTGERTASAAATRASVAVSV